MSRSRPLLVVALATAAFAACGDDDATSVTVDAGAPDAIPENDFTVGGDRPVTVKVPDGHDPQVPAPLVILLHGYSASGLQQEAYFRLAAAAAERGVIYAYPDGTIDQDGNRFWNATDACCDFYATGVDDVAYLMGLVDEIGTHVAIDPKRVYFVGHSNGGFMSHRLACDAGSRIAAFVSLAGDTFSDPKRCPAAAAVSMLQIHGTADDVIAYEGGPFLQGTTLPSAAASVAFWAERAGCDAKPTAGTPIDLERALAGAETTPSVYGGCDAGLAVELWTIAGGGHIPALATDFGARVLDFLLAHPKP